MAGIKDLWPLFVIVGILASLVGLNVMQTRPSAEQIKEIHLEMKADRDSFQENFNAMAFEAEVLDNKTFVRKYPMPDVRYHLNIKNLVPFQKPDSLQAQTPLFDFTNPESAFMWAALDGKWIRKGDKLEKKSGEDFYLVRKKDGKLDTMQLEWRLFVQEELYED